jgi:nucleotidyltransferase substrate binding protein (TIGR01987 family)
MNKLDVRWLQRFDNFRRAFSLLREVCERDLSTLTALEREGSIQRFEFAFELAWKTLKDYLEANGVTLESNTPRQVIKQAFAAQVLDEPQVWIDMMLHRNQLSHTYDFKVFEQALEEIQNRYFPAFDKLHDFFLEQALAS